MLKLLPLLFILPHLAWAMSGKISGTGNAKYASGRNYECSEIFLRFQVRDHELVLHEGGYICGFLQASFDFFKMDIVNGKLMHEGKVLGVINDNQISYEVYDPSDDSTYYFNLNKKEDHYHYFEEWHDGEKMALKVEGHLKKLN